MQCHWSLQYIMFVTGCDKKRLLFLSIKDMNDMKPQISRQHNSRAVGMWITQEMDAMTVGMEQRFCEN